MYCIGCLLLFMVTYLSQVVGGGEVIPNIMQFKTAIWLK